MQITGRHEHTDNHDLANQSGKVLGTFSFFSTVTNKETGNCCLT